MIGARTLVCSLVFILSLPGAASADDLTRYEVTAACYADSDVVGYRQCAPYGAWSQPTDEPYAFVDYGMTWRHFPGKRAPAPDGAARSTTSPAETDTPSSDALVVTERIGVGITTRAYVALEVEMGNFAFAADEHSRDVILGGLGAFGVHGGVGPLTLGGELGAGYRGYAEAHAYDLTGEAVVEARARGRLWLTPWFTIGATAGASLIRRGEWLVGVELGFHTHAFGGQR